MKPAAYEKQWKKQLGNQTTNPNSVNWEQIRKDTEEVCAITQPAGSFTCADYCKNLGLSEYAGRGRLKKLVAAGKYKLLAMRGQGGIKYYVKA